MPIHANVSGTWKQITPWLNVSGTWKSCLLWTNVSGTWKLLNPPAAGSYPMLVTKGTTQTRTADGVAGLDDELLFPVRSGHSYRVRGAISSRAVTGTGSPKFKYRWTQGGWYGNAEGRDAGNLTSPPKTAGVQVSNYYWQFDDNSSTAYRSISSTTTSSQTHVFDWTFRATADQSLYFEWGSRDVAADSVQVLSGSWVYIEELD